MCSINKNEMMVSPKEVHLVGINKDEEEKAFRCHLLALRLAFQENSSIRECLTAQTKQERKEGILHFVHSMAAFNFGGQTLERAIDYLLDELEHMLAAPASLYLVDESTGKAVAPLTKDLVYTPPDFVDEGGNLRKARPVIDPGFASALGLAQQERTRTETALTKFQGWASNSVAHLRDPETILQVAREKLANAGLPEGGTKILELEVGREQSDGVFQAPNPAFHRFILYGQVLAQKILRSGTGTCSLLSLEMKQNSKSRWYRVLAKVPDDFIDKAGIWATPQNL